MQQSGGSMEQALEKWREGRASLEEVRALSRDLGSQHYIAGIPALLQLLDHEDCIVRYNAVGGLAFELHHNPALERLLIMLAQDEDEDCRDAAASGIGNLCQNSKDPRVLAALARAALGDPDEDVRSSAYMALLIVNGVSPEKHLELLRTQNLPVDPSRVKTILAEGGMVDPL